MLELKDKLKAEKDLTNEETKENTKNNVEYSSDAADALQILGYSRKDIDFVLKKINSSLSTEEIIKQALKLLS